MLTDLPILLALFLPAYLVGYYLPDAVAVLAEFWRNHL